MKRRAFITLLGSAAAWPLAAHAQQPTMPVVGFLRSTSALDSADLVAAFRQGLQQTGFTAGQNIAMEYRWADGRDERFAEIAAEFVRLKVDVIVAPPTAGVIAAKQATSVIPIVFATAGDPRNPTS